MGTGNQELGMIIFRKYAILTLILFGIGAACIAQPCPSCPPGDPGGDPDNPVPISGIELLVGAGALLGSMHFLKSRIRKP